MLSSRPEDAMLEALAGTGLAVAAGLNAYIPLLVLGLAGRFLDFVELPAGWAWLENEWVLGILGVLLVVEIIADKIPAVDSVNDIIQTVVRPAVGGIAFGTGAGTQTAVVTDPASFFTSNAWIPVAIGIALALGTHIFKATARPVINTATLGVGAPVASTAEDIGAVLLSVFAILIPVLVIFGLIAFVVIVIVVRRRSKRRTAERAAAKLAAAPAIPAPPPPAS